MTFQELINWYATGSRKGAIKRYITGITLSFGKKFSIPSFPNPIITYGPSPIGNKLQVFNTSEELIAGRSYTGNNEYIDTKVYSEIKTVILDPQVIKEVMEYDGDPNDYFQTYAFNASLIHKGQFKRFRYSHNSMLIQVTTTTNQTVYKKFQAAAEYEKSCQEFVALAQRNAKALAALSIDPNLSSDERAKLNIEITKHQYTINVFKNSLPDGFYVDLKELRADNINGVDQIGIIPIIIWVVVIIVAGIVGLTAYYIDRKNDLAKIKAQMDDRYKAIMSITNDEERNKALVDASKSNSDAIKAGEQNTGMLGQVKQIAMILLGGYVIKEVLPLLTKSSKK